MIIRTEHNDNSILVVTSPLFVETHQREDINDGSRLAWWLDTWQEPDGWHYAFAEETDRDGYIESEDCGPFQDRAAARSAALK